MQYEVSSGGNLWEFYLYSDGYLEMDDGVQQPVDTFDVDVSTKSLIVYRAMNGLDTTSPRLKMRQVFKQCWTMTGLSTSDLQEVVGREIQNTDMEDAIADCRAAMNLYTSTSFEVGVSDTVDVYKSCWDRLEQTIFSAAIRGAIADFGIGKQLALIKVKREGTWGLTDYVYYEFS